MGFLERPYEWWVSSLLYTTPPDSEPGAPDLELDQGMRLE